MQNTMHPVPAMSIYEVVWKMKKNCKKIIKLSFVSFLMITGLCVNALTADAQVAINSIPDTIAIEKMKFTTLVTATEGDNEALTFTAPVLPAWLSFSMDNNSSRLMAEVGYSYGIAADDTGNIYATSQTDQIIYKIKPDGTKIEWLTGKPYASYGLAVHDNYLYISYWQDWACDGLSITRVALNDPAAGEQTVLNSASITAGMGITFKDNYLYFSSYACNKIGRINLTTLASETYINDAAPTGHNMPWGLHFAANGDLYFGTASSGIIRYASGTTTEPEVILPDLSGIMDVKFDYQGYMYVALSGGGIRKYDPTLTSYTQIISTGGIYALDLILGKTLVYTNINTRSVYKLESGAVFTGTPGHADVGRHPVKVTVTNGTMSVDQEFTIIVTDPNPPNILSYSPANNSLDITLDTTLTVEFDEAIVKGSGKIYLKYLDDDRVIGEIDIEDTSVHISDNTVSFYVKGLPNSSQLYITADAGAIRDVNNNDFGGILARAWSFTTISKTAQFISFAADNEVTYGDADYVPGGTINSGLAIDYAVSDESVVSIVDGKIKILKAGTVIITASQAGDINYLAAANVEQVLIVKQKEISLSLNASPEIVKEYDRLKNVKLDEKNYTISGLINMDDVTVSGTAVFENEKAGKNKKIYVDEFALSGDDLNNYKLLTLLDSVTGEIAPKSVEVQLAFQPLISKVYDGTADAWLNASNYVLLGVLGNDEVSATAAASYSDQNAGEIKTVTATSIMLGGADVNNYYLSNLNATVTGEIVKKEVSIIAKNQQKVYGDADPVFTYQVTGILPGEKLPGTLSRLNNKNVGEYAISIGTVNGGNNYELTGYIAGKLSISPAPLMIAVEDKSKAQGGGNPVLTFRYEGLKHGDGAKDLAIQPQAQTTALTGSPIGYYTITAGGAASPNYTISYANGNLTIVPAGNTHIKVWSSNASLLQIRIYSETSQKASLFLYTQNGQPLIKDQKQLQAGINSFTMPVGSVSSGVYLFNVKTEKFEESQKVKIK